VPPAAEILEHLHQRSGRQISKAKKLGVPALSFRGFRSQPCRVLLCGLARIVEFTAQSFNIAAMRAYRMLDAAANL
jgi:hypothetical protein